MQNFEIHGILIETTSKKLPIGMGLSSSAAFCVMMVKSFNEIYHLGLSLDEIKYYAQLGENTALSPCGSLDYEGVTASGLIWYDFLDKTKFHDISCPLCKTSIEGSHAVVNSTTGGAIIETGINTVC